MKAPCGHDGEAVIGNYVRCTRGCDAVPTFIERESTEKWIDLDMATPLADSMDNCDHQDVYTSTIVPGVWCWTCGRRVAR